MMNTFFLKSEFLAEIAIVMVIASPFVFLTGLILLIASPKNKKVAIKLLIGSIIGFIIGFGTCLANLSLNGMH
jgi:disulfide bond formation protein DsbB